MWASPAFLKRSRFHLTDYDPFVDDDFPDNDRRKRTKFGRGSDQWRFTERTPSPEVEPEITPSDITSPSRPPTQDQPRGDEVQGAQIAYGIRSPPVASNVATSALTDRSEVEVQSEGGLTVKDTSVEEEKESPTSLSQVNGEERMVQEVASDEKNGDITDVTPKKPRLVTEINEAATDCRTTGPKSPTSETHSGGDEVVQEPAQIVRASPPVPIEIASSASSSSAPTSDPDHDRSLNQGSDDASLYESDSLFDEDSDSRQSNAFVYSGPESDLGLDGSTFSRPLQPVEFAPPPEVVKRLEEGPEADRLNIDDAQDIQSPLRSDVEQSESEAGKPSFSMHSANDLSSSEDEGSDEGSDEVSDEVSDEGSDEDISMPEGHDAAQRRSSVSMPSFDQLGGSDAGVLDDQARKDPARSQLAASNRSSSEGMGVLQDEGAVQRSSSSPPSSPNQFGSQESQEKLVFSSQEIPDDRAALQLIPEQSLTDFPERKSQTSSEENENLSAASDEDNTLETSPEKGLIESKMRQESSIALQQGMELDARLSQEGSRIASPQGQKIRDRAEDLGTVTSGIQQSAVEIIDLESSDEDNASPQVSSQTGPQAVVDENDAESAPTQKVSAHGTRLMLASDARSVDQILIDEAYHLSSRPASTELVLKHATAVENTPPTDIHIEPDTYKEAREPGQEGSRTQSLAARSEKCSEEPPLRQEAPLERSEGMLRGKEQRPLLERLEIEKTDLKPTFTEELPSTVPESIEEIKSKSQLLTPSSTQTNFLSQSPSVSLHSVPEDDTLPTPRLTQGTSTGIVLPQPLAPPEEPTLVKTPAPPKKTSALIERLKEMRRLSSQSLKPRSSDASILDPWFTPRRVSQVVPDSEDGSEAEGSTETEAQATAPKIVGKKLARTPEKALAKSFIRSPSQTQHISSIQSSPQYLPPSQPPPPGFRTNLSYFVPLATLPSHFSTKVDVLAIALSGTPVTRATSGPKDYNQSLYITDPSSLALQHSITTAQIFRPNNRCFPILEKGSALLLRDFKVQPFEKRLVLLSTESSAWAVFRKGADVQVRGPPVEYGAEERGFARGLWDWWASLGDDARKRLENAVPEYKKPTGTAKTTKPKAGRKKSDTPIKKEQIEGLGVDLPGSQDKRRDSMKERSLALDGVEDRDMVYESIEAPKRVLRARGAKGANGRSESARESRFGTVFTGGLGEPDETQGSAHELRDGKAYRTKGR